MILMCGLVIFCRGIGKTALLTSIHHCTSLSSYPKLKWVSWHPQTPTLQSSVIPPAIFLCNAQLSGKAGRKFRAKFLANLEQEVQQVLQNHLHYTRSLSFADAEHISLDAPFFWQKLVSRVNTQKHISKVLERYLLYNPINEFEPFFESIGVKISEIHRFLPNGKIYLNEEEFLLANVSTLTNSGFPRHVLGKLYKEQPELFSCSAAKLQNKLRFYEKLGVSKVSLIRILTCCPSLLCDDVHRKFETVANGLNEFQVEKNRICCLMERNPLKCSSILEKLMLLAGVCCPWDGITMLYRTKPQLFIDSSEKALYSIVDSLSNLGLKKENIGGIILRYPEILKWDPSKSVAVNLKSFGLDQKETIDANLCYPHNLHADNLMKFIEDVNCSGLEKQGGSELVHGRDDLVVYGAKLKHASGTREINISENLEEPIQRQKLIFLLKLGLHNDPEWMIKFARKSLCGSDKLQERLSCLLRLGFPFNVVCQMVRIERKILNQSADLIEKKFEFLCSTTFDPLEALTSFPRYFSYSLEGRIKPRYKIYAWLRTNDLLKRESSFCSIFGLAERKFVQEYVNCHPEGSKYFSLCKLEQVMPSTLLSKVSSEKFQNMLSGGSEPIDRRDDGIICGAKLKHTSGTQEIYISEHLREPIRRQKLNFLLKLGLLNYPEWMIKFARRILCGSDKLQERLSCLLRLGFPFNVVCQMVRKEPRILNQSACLIQKKFDFLYSTTFKPLQALKSFPQYFSCNLERRIKPRYKMYLWLKKNDLLKEECSATGIFRLQESRFIRKYVNCHPEGSKYYSLCKLGQVIPRTPLSEVSSEKNQNMLSGGSELVHRRDDLIVCAAKLKHASGTQEINISENLQEPIRRHKLNFLLKLGLLNDPEWMIKFATKIHCGSDKLQERINCLLSLGLPFNAVCQMVRIKILFLNQSADLIQNKFDFLCSITFNPLQFITSFPHYFCYHLEGRIKPRYKMYVWLKTNDLEKQECSFKSIFGLPEVRFIQKYVNCHPEGGKYFSLCKLGQV